jgi:hypothetical protein
LVAAIFIRCRCASFTSGCTDIAIIEQPALPAELTTTLELAADFARASKAKATQEAYESDFRIFQSLVPFPGIERSAGHR